MKSFAIAWAKIRQIASVVRLKPFDDMTPAGRSKERYRRVALTSLAAIIARGVGAITSLVSVPLTLHYLGPERYGLWMTISSAIALLGFADLGMGNGLLNAIAEANGKDDAQAARKYISSGFFLLLGIALLILVGFFAIYSLVPWSRVFNVTSAMAVSEAGPATIVLVFSFIINIPLGIVQRVQLGYQEGFKNSLWSVTGAVMGLAGVLLAIYLRAGLPWLVFAMSGGPILALGLNWIHVFGYSHRSLIPSLNSFRWQASWKLARTGFLFCVMQLLALIGNHSDNLVIAQVSGASAVAGYAVVQKLFFITLVAQYFLLPLWPAFGEAMARNDHAWARRTLNRALALSLGFGAITSLPLLVFGQRFVLLWAGYNVVPSKILLLGFTFWVLVNCFVGSISTFLNSGKLLGRQVPIFALASLVALALKIVGAQYWQVEGVVWATVAGYGLFYIIPATRLAYGALKSSPING